MTRVLLSALALIVLLMGLLGAAPIRAQVERSSTVEHLELAIDVLADGTIAVSQTERIRYHGRFQRDSREIPFQRIGSLTEIQLGEPGQPYRQGYNEPGTFSATRDGQTIRIDWWFPPLTDAARATTLSYRVAGALRATPEADLLRWVAIPAGRAATVEAASVVVRLPRASQPDQVNAQAWVGGVPTAVDVLDGREARLEIRSLGPEEALELEVSFPKGIATVPVSALQWVYDLQAAVASLAGPGFRLVVLGLSGLVLAIGLPLVLRGIRSRAPARSAPGATADLPPALAGALIDGQTDGREAAATLLDLIDRGVLEVEPTSVETQLRPGRGAQRPLGLEPYEQTLLAGVCLSDQPTALSALASRWPACRALFAGQIEATVAARGLAVANHEAGVKRSRLLAAAGLAACAALGLTFQAALGEQLELVWAPFAAGGLVCLAVILAAGRRSPLTERGRAQAATVRSLAAALRAGGGLELNESSGRGWRRLAYGVALGLDESALAQLADRPAARLAATAGRGGAGSPDERPDPVALADAALRAFGSADGASPRR